MHKYNFPRPASSLGDMLMDFFELYGERFNYAYSGLAVRDGGSYYRKFDKYGIDAYLPCLFSIEDPQEDHAEIARNSFAALTIQKAFSNALQLLELWRPDEATDEQPTPLSTILHVDELIWNRRGFVGAKAPNAADTEVEPGKQEIAATGPALSNGVQAPSHQVGNSQSAEDGEVAEEGEVEEDRYEPQPMYTYKPTAFPNPIATAESAAMQSYAPQGAQPEASIAHANTEYAPMPSTEYPPFLGAQHGTNLPVGAPPHNTAPSHDQGPPPPPPPPPPTCVRLQFASTA